MMILTTILAAIVMTVWNRFKVNYPFILEMDVTYKLTPIDIFRFSSMFLSLWLVCYFGDLVIIKYEYYFNSTPAPFTLALYIVFFGIFLMPFSILYSKGRFALLKTLGQVYISPFGPVRFRQYFLGELLVSTTSIMKDLGIAIFIFGTGKWKNSEYLDESKYVGLFYWKSVVSCLPYWIRFWQCVVRYRETHMTLYFVNCFKQATGFIAALAGVGLYLNDKAGYIDKDVAFNITVLLTFFANMFGYCWDIYVDFGLCRTLAPGKAFLRPKLLYPKWFYYFAMVSNLFMRLARLMTSFLKYLPTWILDHQVD